jgi:hypothetical protein
MYWYIASNGKASEILKSSTSPHSNLLLRSTHATDYDHKRGIKKREAVWMTWLKSPESAPRVQEHHKSWNRRRKMRNLHRFRTWPRNVERHYEEASSEVLLPEGYPIHDVAPTISREHNERGEKSRGKTSKIYSILEQSISANWTKKFKKMRVYI